MIIPKGRKMFWLCSWGRGKGLQQSRKILLCVCICYLFHLGRRFLDLTSLQRICKLPVVKHPFSAMARLVESPQEHSHAREGSGDGAQVGSGARMTPITGTSGPCSLCIRGNNIKPVFYKAVATSIFIQRNTCSLSISHLCALCVAGTEAVHVPVLRGLTAP